MTRGIHIASFRLRFNERGMGTGSEQKERGGIEKKLIRAHLG